MLINFDYEDNIEVYANPDLWFTTFPANTIDDNVTFTSKYLFTKVYLNNLVNDTSGIDETSLAIKDHITADKLNKLTYALNYYGKGISEGLTITLLLDGRLQIDPGVAIVDNAVIVLKNTAYINPAADYSNPSSLKTGLYHLVLKYTFDSDNVDSKAYFDVIPVKDWDSLHLDIDPRVLSLGTVFILSEQNQHLDIDNLYHLESCNRHLKSCIYTPNGNVYYIFSSHGAGGRIYPYGAVKVVNAPNECDLNRLFLNGSYLLDGHLRLTGLIDNFTYNNTVRYNRQNRYRSFKNICNIPVINGNIAGNVYYSGFEWSKYKNCNIDVVNYNSYNLNVVSEEDFNNNVNNIQYIFRSYNDYLQSYSNDFQYIDMNYYNHSGSITYAGLSINCKLDQSDPVCSHETLNLDGCLQSTCFAQTPTCITQNLFLNGDWMFNGINNDQHAITLDNWLQTICNSQTQACTAQNLFLNGSWMLSGINNNHYTIPSELLQLSRIASYYPREYNNYPLEPFDLNYPVNMAWEIRYDGMLGYNGYYPRLLYNKTWKYDKIHKYNGWNTNCGIPSYCDYKGSGRWFTIIPDEYYKVKALYIDGIKDDPQNYYEFYNLVSNRTIYAEFEPIKMTIIASSNGPGSISPSGIIYVPWGQKQTFEFYPHSADHYNYRLASLKVDNEYVTPHNGKYTFYNVKESHTIEAYFESYETHQYYDVNIVSHGNGYANPNGFLRLNKNEDLLITFQPDPGYKVDYILINGEKQNDTYFYTIQDCNKAYNIEAFFVEGVHDIYKITAIVHEHGKVNPFSETITTIDVTKGMKQLVTIIPEDKYKIAKVFIDGVDHDSISSFEFFEPQSTMYADTSNLIPEHTIEVWFEENYCLIALENLLINSVVIPDGNNVNGGNIYPAGLIQIKEHANQLFYIVPDSGYEIEDVEIDGLSYGNITSFTFTDVVSSAPKFQEKINDKDILVHHTIKAKFRKTVFDINVIYSGNGEVDPFGKIKAEYGSNVQIVMKPDIGHTISKLLVNKVEKLITNRYILENITMDYNVEVVFEPMSYIIQVETVGKGSVFPEGLITVKHNDNIELRATAEKGFRVKTIKVDGLEQGSYSTYRLKNINRDHSISIEFEPDVFVIQARYTTGGLIIPHGDVLVTRYDNQKFKMHPNEGYILSSVRVDGRMIGAASEYEFTSVENDHIISAEFIEYKKKHIIYVTTMGNGSATPTGTIECEVGGNCKINIVSHLGHKIDSIYVNGENVDTLPPNTESYQLQLTNVMEDKKVSVTFGEKCL